MSLWSRIGNVFRGDNINREIDEEFEAHIAEAIAEGRDPEEARRAFGSVRASVRRAIRSVSWGGSKAFCRIRRMACARCCAARR